MRKEILLAGLEPVAKTLPGIVHGEQRLIDVASCKFVGNLAFNASTLLKLVAPAYEY